MRLTVRLPVLAAILALCSPRRATADPKSDAQTHIDNAKTLFGSNKPAEALEELRIAYSLDPRPSLLYAIGQAYARLGQCADAKTFYGRFLDSKPAASAASLTKDAIAACKDKVAEPSPVPAPLPSPAPKPAPVPVATPPAPEGPAPWYADAVGDALTGGGALVGIIGLVVYDAALGNVDAAASATTHQQASDLVAKAHDQRTEALVLGVGAVGLVTAGLVHYATRSRGEPRGIAITPSTGGALVTWGTAF